MSITLQEIVDAYNEGLLTEGDFGPLEGQINARRKQSKYDALDKAEAEGIDVLKLLKDAKK